MSWRNKHIKGFQAKFDGSDSENKCSGERNHVKFNLKAVTVKKYNFTDTLILCTQYLSRDEHTIKDVGGSYETDAQVSKIFIFSSLKE